MWISQLNWDDVLPGNLRTMWLQVEEDLDYINYITIPRYVFTSNNNMVQIHGFADASQRAYGCCIYVRATFNDSHQYKLSHYHALNSVRHYYCVQHVKK